MNGLQWLLQEGGFSAMAICLASDEFALTYSIFANALIAVSYLLIWLQLTIAGFKLSHGKRLVFEGHSWVLVLFGSFILACGLGHGLMLMNFFRAFYRLEAAWMVFTALLSAATALMLPFMVKLEPAPPAPPAE